MEGIIFQEESAESGISSDLRTAYEENNLNSFFSIFAAEEVTGIPTIEDVLNYVNENHWYQDQPYLNPDEILLDWQIVEPAGFNPSEEALQGIQVECVQTGKSYTKMLGTSMKFAISQNGTYTFNGSAQNGATTTRNIKVTSIVDKLVESITLSDAAVTIEAGDIYDVYATINPQNATNKTIIWTSSDESIVTIDREGKILDEFGNRNNTTGGINACKAGTATIRATATDGSGVYAECTVTVTPVVAFTQNNIDYTWEDVHEMAKIISSRFGTTGNGINKTTRSVTINYPASSGNTVTLSVGQEMQLKNSAYYQGHCLIQDRHYKVRILGFNADKLASISNTNSNTTYTGTYAGITFGFVNCLLYNNRMNNTKTNVGGWRQAGLRNYLNQELAIIDSEYFKTVQKKYNIGNMQAQNAQTPSEDKLWLLACSEIWPKGMTSMIALSIRSEYENCWGCCSTNESTMYDENDPNEECRYAYYANFSEADYSNIKTYYWQNGSLNMSNGDYWLRSPNANTTIEFCSINGKDISTPDADTSNCYVSPGFCI